MTWVSYVTAIAWIWGTLWAVMMVVTFLGYMIVPPGDDKEQGLLKGVVSSLLLGLPAWAWLLMRTIKG